MVLLLPGFECRRPEKHKNRLKFLSLFAFPEVASIIPVAAKAASGIIRVARRVHGRTQQ
jgi:hypothetical protein